MITTHNIKPATANIRTNRSPIQTNIIKNITKESGLLRNE